MIDKPELNGIVKEILLGFLPVAGKAADGSEPETVIKNVRLIIDTHMREIRAAAMAYRETGDLDTLFFALLQVHNKIRYEAYAPYWLSHCKPVDDHDSETEFTYYNDLIDMYWAWQWQEWKKKDVWCVTVMLPPTGGLMDLAYREGRQLFEEYKRNTAGEKKPLPDSKTDTGR